MNKRAVIIVSGEVQEAGYRAHVMRTAQKLGLEGYVRNLPNGTIEIICEGEENKIKELMEKINIKTMTINIEKIKTTHDNYTGEFEGKGFVPKIGDKLEDLAYEMFQGNAAIENYLKIRFTKQDKLFEKLNKLGE